MEESLHPFEVDGQPVWAIKLACAIDRTDEHDCLDILLEAIGCLLPHDMASMFVYSGNSRPVIIHDTNINPAARRGLINYVKNTYVLNPIYNAYLKGLQPGVYRINEVAPDDYFNSGHFKNFRVKHSENEELNYITDGWPRHMEEIFIAVQLPENRLGEICLLRAVARGGFNEAEIIRLRRVAPVIGSVFRRHWQHMHQNTGQGEAALSIEELFENLSGDLLSPREREVGELILKGHSGHSISDRLGISITTVKSHRQNLYGKLGIATQFELFSLFLKSIPSVLV